ncbi:MAG TPA: TetR/AcrR family transcriptional regulator [Saprospiraceae bacterium]|nr:TetR/AcrR family transcriptional regulator [Saprospiraceae bacterium]
MNITDRQLEIIEASGKILTTNGLSGLTIKTLSQAIGFSEAALYRHFKSKEDVIVLLIKYLHANMHARLGVIYHSQSTAEAKIISIFESQLNYLSTNPHLVITVLSDGLIDESKKIKTAIEELFVFKYGMIFDLVNQLIHEYKLDDKVAVQSLTQLLLGGFRMLMLRWKFSKFEFNLSEEGIMLIEDFIKLIKLNTLK